MDGEFAGLFGREEGDDLGNDEGASTRGVGSFMGRYGWHYQTELVAKLEGIRLQEAYELTTIAYLNDLAYLKAKAEHERQELKRITKGGKVN